MPPTMPKFDGAMTGRHLGRSAPTPEQRRKALPLRNFVKLGARPVPSTDDYATKAQGALTKMMGNDAEGCCVATSIAKEFGIENSYRPGGSVVVATDAEVSKWYHQVGGRGDNGLVIIEAFEFAIRQGMTIGGKVYKLEGYAALDNSDDALVDAAFHWFGGLHLGVALTRQQYLHAEDSDVWDDDGSDVVGGHSIPITKRTPEGFTLATWARQPRMTRRLMRSRRWCDECYVTITDGWFDKSGIDTNAVNVDALRAALAAIKAGGTPDIPPDPNPPGPGPGPGPGPVGPGDVLLDGWVEVFGQRLPVHLAGKVSAQFAAVRTGPNWFVLVMDALAIVNALRARDWAALMLAVEKLVADLGGLFTADERRSLAAAIIASADTLPLTQTKQT